MPQDKVIVKPGARVTVEVSEETGRGDIAGVVGGADGGDGLNGVLEGARVEDTPFRRIAGGITFYDLGTRREEAGTYRDIVPSTALVTVTVDPLGNHYIFTYEGEEFAYDWLYPFDTPNPITLFYTAILTAGDFSRGNTCFKLPFLSEWAYLDADFLPSNLDLDIERQEIGKAKTRPYIGGHGLGGLISGDMTLVDKTTWKASGLPFKHKEADEGEFYLGLDTAFFYSSATSRLPDNPGNPRYKVTLAPDFNAEGVILKVSNKMKVFLVPRMYLESTGTTPNHLSISRLVPFGIESAQPLTGYALVFENFGYHPGAGNPQFVLHATATPDFWAKINAYYIAHFSAPFAWGAGRDNVIDTFAPPLVAIVEQGGDLHYIWYLQQPGDITGQLKCRILRPGA